MNESLHKAVRHYVNIWLLYLAMVIAVSWPLILHFRTSVPGHPWLAVKIHLWQFWWTKEAILSADWDLFRTHLLYFPDGLNTLTEMGNFLLPILSVPFQVMFGLAGGYNAVFLLSFAATGTAVYALCNRFGASRMACFIGGASCVFLPYAWMKVLDAEFEIAVLFWLPVGCIQIDRCFERPSLARGAVLGLILFLSAMSSWYYGFFLSVAVGIGALLFCFERLRNRQFKTAGTVRMLTALGLALLLHCGLMLPFVLELNKTERVRDLDWIEESQEWDLTAKANPDVFELIAPWERAPSDRAMVESAEYGIPYPFAVFPGFLTLFLALYGLTSRPGVPATLWVPAVFFWIVSLGPWLKIGGRTDLLPFHIPLPAYYLASCFRGFAAITIHSYRAVVLLLLLLCVLAAKGFDHLMQQMKLSGPGRNFMVAAVAVMMGFDAVDSAGIPRPLRRTSTVVPAIYDQLDETKGSGVVVNIPVTEVDHVVADYMFAQTRHRRPIIAGRSYEGRVPGRWGELVAGLQYRQLEDKTDESILDPSVRMAGFAAKGVRFFVVHRRWLSESRALDVRTLLAQTCTLVAEDLKNGIAIYELDSAVGGPRGDGAP